MHTLTVCWIKERTCDKIGCIKVCYPAFVMRLASPWQTFLKGIRQTSFDILYTLARKLEARQPPHSQNSSFGSTDLHRHKYRRYPTPAGRVATLEEEELFPPDPESHELKMPEFDQIEGLSLCMTQAMDHLKCKEHKCIVCGTPDNFARDCPHRETFHK